METTSISHITRPDIKAIYEEGIATGHATFETTAATWEDWEAAHLAGA